MTKFIKYKFKKLIRTKLPNRMIDEGVLVHRKELSQDEFRLHLKNKIIEEAAEVKDAEDTHHLTIELADLLEVIYTLAKASNIKMGDVEKARMEKLSVNGDFSAKNYITYVEVAEDNRKVIEYLNKKNRPYKLV